MQLILTAGPLVVAAHQLIRKLQIKYWFYIKTTAALAHGGTENHHLVKRSYSINPYKIVALREAF